MLLLLLLLLLLLHKCARACARGRGGARKHACACERMHARTDARPPTRTRLSKRNRFSACAEPLSHVSAALIAQLARAFGQ